MLATSPRAMSVRADVPEIALRDVHAHEFGTLFPDIDRGRIAFALMSPDHGAAVAFGREGFDSELFGLEIGRILATRAPGTGEYRQLFASVTSRARVEGYDQVLHRTVVADLPQVWALEATGFELLDVGVTFSQAVTAGRPRPAEHPDLHIALSTDADLEAIAGDMVEQPWGSRYEADPAYSAACVRELRSRWLVNSHRGRAQAFFVGTMEGRPAGYVTCLMDARTGHGEIELVGTLPAFRGRRVASRILEHALWWFSSRTTLVTVRTQSTNIGAATLYERAGFTLHSSDLTFRAALGPAQSGRS